MNKYHLSPFRASSHAAARRGRRGVAGRGPCDDVDVDTDDNTTRTHSRATVDIRQPR